MKIKNKPAFKIALVGTACVGKTSIFQNLRDKYQTNPSIGFVEEAARIFFQSNPKIPDRFTLKVQEQILQMILDMEKKANVKEVTSILCDRSAADAVVYAVAADNKKLADHLVKKTLPYLSTYSKIFLLDPAGIPYLTDTIRNESPGVRQKLHMGFIDFFEKTKTPYELLSGSLEKRITRVDKLLNAGH